MQFQIKITSCKHFQKQKKEQTTNDNNNSGVLFSIVHNFLDNNNKSALIRLASGQHHYLTMHRGLVNATDEINRTSPICRKRYCL
jgi:hypothetical protein